MQQQLETVPDQVTGEMPVLLSLELIVILCVLSWLLAKPFSPQCYCLLIQFLMLNLPPSVSLRFKLGRKKKKKIQGGLGVYVQLGTL